MRDGRAEDGEETGGEWGGSTVNMPTWQARSNEAEEIREKAGSGSEGLLLWRNRRKRVLYSKSKAKSIAI
jgi:hypothetical protein